MLRWGTARDLRCGFVGHGTVRLGLVGQGLVGQGSEFTVWSGMVLLGWVRFCSEFVVRLGLVWQGAVLSGLVWDSRYCLERSGLVWYGVVLSGAEFMVR